MKWETNQTYDEYEDVERNSESSGGSAFGLELENSRNNTRVTRKGHNSCIFALLNCSRRDKNVPLERRISVILDSKIYIPNRAVCCMEHLAHDTIWLNIPILIREIDRLEYEEMVDFLISHITSKSRAFDFSDLAKISEDIIVEWTGLRKQDFSCLSCFLGNDAKARNKLASFLIKLRRDIPFTSISQLLGPSERTLRRWFDDCIDKLGKAFVPQNLGFLGSIFGVGDSERLVVREFSDSDVER